MQDLLFDTPYWVLGALGVAGIALIVSGNSRQEKWLKRSGLGLLIIAIALALISHFVETDKEKVDKATRQLLAAVEKKDKPAMLRLLHPNASLLGRLNKQEIANRAAAAVEEYRISNIRATSLEMAQPNANEVTVNMAVSAHTDAVKEGDFPSSWQLTWEKSGGEWLLRDIRPVKVPYLDISTLIERWAR